MSIKPLTPAEVDALSGSHIPDGVIEVVNAMLVEKSAGKSMVTINMKELVKRIVAAHAYDTETIYDNNYLDFEQLYRNNGWRVDFYKETYGDSTPSHWVFSRK